MKWFHCKKDNFEDIFAKSSIMSLAGGQSFCHQQNTLRSGSFLTTHRSRPYKCVKTPFSRNRAQNHQPISSSNNPFVPQYGFIILTCHFAVDEAEKLFFC